MRITSSALLALAASAWCCVLFLSARATSSAFVFGDEAGYFLPIIFGTSPANYQKWGAVMEYPAYLYFWLYSFLPRDNLHLWIKALNAIFIAAAAPPAYLIAKRFMTGTAALLFACFVIAMPIASFVRYVMPEPMYFFGFWFALWVIWRALDWSPFAAVIAGGVVFGLLALVKPHAVALAVALSLFLALRQLNLRGVLAAVVQFGLFLLVHAGVGYLLTGHPVWSLSSGSYAGTMQTRVDVLAALINMAGHSAALATLLGPLVIVPVVVWWRDRSGAMGQFSLLAICLLLAMLAMTVYFSQGVYQIAPATERITRLHGRYYLYAFPLFLLIGAVALYRNPAAPISAKMWPMAFLIASPLCGAAILLFYEVGPVDFPDLALWGGRYLLPVSIAFIGLQAGLAIYGWFYASARRLVAISCAVFVLFALATTCAFVLAAPLTLARKPFDAAFLNAPPTSQLGQLIGRSDGVVIGRESKADELARALFYLKSLSQGRFAPSHDRFDDTNLSDGIKWALVLPGVKYLGTQRVVTEGEFAVVWRDAR